MANTTLTSAIPAINADAMLEHWQGHRRLTRKMIETFPENELFTHSVAGMRPFAGLVMEMLRIAAGGIHGIVGGNWNAHKRFSWYGENDTPPATKKELLEAWDEVTAELDANWPKITEERFQEQLHAFGNESWAGPAYSIIQYFVDNEIHHRGQGYVYLRSLGITPPGFWERW
ncbi:DinB family protein [Chitinophaga sp. 22620]|uniref:DinB family protein n=1 Tax=Chitinophaga sp. 22620 TaxID=3453952 RepID=UPI003F85B101